MLLQDGLVEILNKNVSLKKLSRKETKIKSKPWITKDIFKLIKSRDMMYKRLVKSNFKDGLLHKNYKKLKNKITHQKEKSKRSYYQKLFTNTKDDHQKTWNTINKLMGQNKKTVKLPSKLIIKI